VAKNEYSVSNLGRSDIPTHAPRRPEEHEENPHLQDRIISKARIIANTVDGGSVVIVPHLVYSFIPDALQVAPISDHGNVMEITSLFGGAVTMKQTVDTMQSLLYKM